MVFCNVIVQIAFLNDSKRKIRSFSEGRIQKLERNTMNRRLFLRLPFKDVVLEDSDKRDSSLLQNESSIGEYTKPLVLSDVYHLLRRLSFAPTYDTASALVGKSAAEAIDTLLGNATLPLENLPTWINDVTENPKGADIFTQNGIYSRWSSQFANFQSWWINRMINERMPVSEKLTTFWSGHFTSEFAFDDNFIPPQQLFRQYQAFYNDKLGSFKKMVFDITLDGAMLVYLGGSLNVKGKPNENYARELMELFTTGIGQYTEGDIQEAARILTGWKVGLYNDEPALNGYFAPYFSPTLHDTGAKQFLGATIPARDADSNTEYLVKTQEIQKLVDILFERRSDAIARFMARKLYRFFIYSNPNGSNEEFISELAKEFKNNDFEIKPTLKKLLTSELFFAEENRGVQIKTPLEFVVGLGRQLGVSLNDPVGQTRTLEQSLMDPPNVAGWDGYRTWISTKTYPARRKYATDVVNSMNDSQLLSFAKQFPDYKDADKVTTAIELYLLPKEISTGRHTNYRDDILLQKQPQYEWEAMLNAGAPAARGIKALLLALIKAPDFQLC